MIDETFKCIRNLTYERCACLEKSHSLKLVSTTTKKWTPRPLEWPYGTTYIAYTASFTTIMITRKSTNGS